MMYLKKTMKNVRKHRNIKLVRTQISIVQCQNQGIIQQNRFRKFINNRNKKQEKS